MMGNRLIFVLLATIFMISFVSGSMPPVHEGVQQISMETYTGPSTDVYKACSSYPELCFIGNQYADFSVVYYYVSNGIKYQITHSPGFVVSMWENAVGTSGIATIEEEQACAAGAMTHAVQDHPIHTSMVPYCIHHTGLPNSIVHVLCEQHQANIFIKDNPELRGGIIEKLTEDDWNKCKPLLLRTLEGYNEYEDDLREGETEDLLNYFISEVTNSIDPNAKTNYDISFKNKVSVFGRVGLVPTGFLLWYLGFMFLLILIPILLLFKKGKRWYNWLSMFIFAIPAILMIILFISLLTGNAFNTLISFVSPLSYAVPIGSYEPMINTQVSNMHKLFSQGQSFIASVDKPLIASGFTELHKADADIRFLSYLWFIIPLTILLFLIWINFRKPKNKRNNSFDL